MNSVNAVTGSDAVILTQSLPSKTYNIPNPSQQEFRLTLTIHWEEFRAAGQPAGTLWLAYNLAKNTSALPGIGVEVPIVTPDSHVLCFVDVNERVMSMFETATCKWTRFDPPREPLNSSKQSKFSPPKTSYR